MAFQTGKNVLIAYKAETTFATPATAAAANRFRPNASAGLKFSRAMIRANEIRSDGMTSMGRLGSYSVAGSYAADASVGTFDPLFEAVLRSTWVPAVVLTQATGTSVTATAGPPGTIVRVAGSWITDGVRVGDVVLLNATGGPAANNNRNLRVVGVSALTLTVAETLVVDATGRTTYTLTIPKKLFQPATPVRRSFTFEEYDADIDLTEQTVGARISSLKLSGGPDAMAILEFGLVGANLIPLTTGTSPYFAAPTLSSTIALTLADATLRFGGVDVATLTAFDLMYDMTAKGIPVIGGLQTPDIFENPATVSGSVSGVRSDFTNLNRFVGETELELHVLLVEPTVEPKAFISVFIPRIKLTGADSAFGADGAMIEVMPFTVGPKQTGVVGYDPTMISITTSAP